MTARGLRSIAIVGAVVATLLGISSVAIAPSVLSLIALATLVASIFLLALSNVAQGTRATGGDRGAESGLLPSEDAGTDDSVLPPPRCQQADAKQSLQQARDSRLTADCDGTCSAKKSKRYWPILLLVGLLALVALQELFVRKRARYISVDLDAIGGKMLAVQGKRIRAVQKQLCALDSSRCTEGQEDWKCKEDSKNKEGYCDRTLRLHGLQAELFESLPGSGKKPSSASDEGEGAHESASAIEARVNILNQVDDIDDLSTLSKDLENQHDELFSQFSRSHAFYRLMKEGLFGYFVGELSESTNEIMECK